MNDQYMTEYVVTVATDQGVVVDQIGVGLEDVETSIARASLGDRIAEIVERGERIAERERGEA